MSRRIWKMLRMSMMSLEVLGSMSMAQTVAFWAMEQVALVT